MAVEKLKDKIARLHSTHPNRSAHGQLYRLKKETQGRWSAVNLWTLFKSDEDTHIFLPHIFEAKKAPRTAKGWDDWFTKHLTKIHTESIIPGLNMRTGKLWQVRKILGFTRHDIRKSDSAAVAARVVKTKSKRRAHG